MAVSKDVQFKFVSLSQEQKADGVGSGKENLSSRVYEALLRTVSQWFHFSLLRQVLLETRSLVQRIS